MIEEAIEVVMLRKDVEVVVEGDEISLSSFARRALNSKELRTRGWLAIHFLGSYAS